MRGHQKTFHLESKEESGVVVIICHNAVHKFIPFYQTAHRLVVIYDVYSHLGTFQNIFRSPHIFQLFLSKRDRPYTKALSQSYFRSSKSEISEQFTVENVTNST